MAFSGFIDFGLENMKFLQQSKLWAADLVRYLLFELSIKRPLRRFLTGAIHRDFANCRLKVAFALCYDASWF